MNKKDGQGKEILVLPPELPISERRRRFYVATGKVRSCLLECGKRTLTRYIPLIILVALIFGGVCLCQYLGTLSAPPKDVATSTSTPSVK